MWILKKSEQFTQKTKGRKHIEAAAIRTALSGRQPSMANTGSGEPGRHPKSRVGFGNCGGERQS
jgi:hypothetical protein